MSELILFNTYVFINYVVLFAGIFLTKFFTDKCEYRKSYKNAVIVNVIWIVSSFVVSYLLNVMIIYELTIAGAETDVILFVGIIGDVIILFLNFLIIMLLIKIFYKSGYNNSIFISLAIVSIQVLSRIIVANILSIIFNLTTGGIISFYVFQFS